METGENKVLIATYGTFSTGISINNLHNIFLVESYKSEVLIKQSLGRGMRKMEGKEKVNIIDFVDDFSTVGYKNYLMKHSEARIAIYNAIEKFNDALPLASVVGILEVIQYELITSTGDDVE